MKINCDQVSHIENTLSRYITTKHNLVISREREMMIYACMYEIIEILNLEFEDDAARNNATPRDVRTKCFEDGGLSGIDENN